MIDPKALDSKRQKKWKESWIYKVVEDTSKEKFYILDMFPYPSWAWLHVWHPKWYIASDSIARKKMLEWYNVLHPMWFDTFWLWTETYAIQKKMKPQIVAQQNIDTYIKQLEMFGTTYDWSRSVNTADPKYYKWTQRIFLKMYNHYYDEKLNKAMPITDPSKQERLAYVDYKPINRCPSCMTWLANEDLDDGKCERCSTVVEQKPMKQRVLRITKYAQRLLDWLDKLNREESMKDLEKNRIWKSEGTQFKMNVFSTSHREEWNDVAISKIASPWARNDSWLNFEVYTTRVDTVFGMSFVVMAPEHPLVDQITTYEYKKDVEKYKEEAKHKTQLERTELQKDKSWQFTWAYAINPFNWEQVPIYIADYVLANYGTWVVMAVPAHDERDWEFAKKYNIPITQSIMPDSFDAKNPPREWKKNTERNTVHIILRNTQDKTVLVQFLKGEQRGDLHPKTFIIGGIEDWESELEAAIREIKEETWYTNIKFIEKVPFEIQANFFAAHKDVNRKIHVNTLIFDLIGNERIEITEDEHFNKDSHEQHWIPYDKVAETINIIDDEMSWKYFYTWWFAYTEKWILINSWEFSWLTSDEAIQAMQIRLEQNNIWSKKINYKIQDRVFSRQRYRWEPFPILRVDEQAKLEINFYNQATRQAIIDWIKTIETRALNPQEKDRYFGDVQVWDILKLNNKETWESVFIKIRNTYKRKNLEELRNNKDKSVIEKMYTNKSKFAEIKTFEDFAKWRDFQEGYLDKINNNWLVWREFDIIQIPQKTIALNESELPLTLPDVDNYEPTGTVEWPLAAIDDRVNITLPDGTTAKRETNTMPWRAGSSRYWLRYMDPNNENALVWKQQDAYRKNVDIYIWWAEHVTRHMIYARFWQKFLFDIWIVSQDEPFEEYHYVWLIMWEDWRKMSKRRWNVVNPDEIINEFWADTLRTYEMFMWPFDQAIARSTNGIKWVKKFLDKIIALKGKISDEKIFIETAWTEWNKQNLILVELHKTIKKVGEDIDNFRFNTAISQLMIFVNKLSEEEKIDKDTFKQLIILVSPFAPHTAEELREQIWEEFSIFTKWKRPKYDQSIVDSFEIINLPIQINGKMRWTIQAKKDLPQENVINLVKSDPKLSSYITWEPKKIIYVQWKILNIIL